MVILGILDSTDMYGKERANMEVYHILQENGRKVIVGYSENATPAMKKELDSYDGKTFSYPRDLKGRFRILKYLENFIKIQFQMSFWLKKHKPDYVLVPTEWALTYLFLPFYFSKSIVVFRCGDDPLTYRKKNKWFTGIYSILWKKIILKRVDVLVSNALYIQRRMKDSGRIDKGRDQLIYNFPPIRKNIKDNVLKINKNGIVFGFIGRIVPEKGVKELLEAMSILKVNGKKMSLLIAGDPLVDKPYADELYSIIKNNNIEQNVNFVGKINDVASFYKTCDVICIPSIYEEPMANVVAESKSYHKPCIIFNQGGMPEIVKDKVTGMVVNEVSVEGLSNAMAYYIDNPNEVLKQGEEAFLSIKKLNLDYSHFVAKWLSVFQEN